MPRQALLVTDVQQAVTDRFAADGYLPRLARASGIPVIYAVVGFRPGHPEISTRDKTFAAVASRAAGPAGDGPATRVHPDVAPAPGETVVTRRRVSAFAGSDLDLVLRAGRPRSRPWTPGRPRSDALSGRPDEAGRGLPG